MAQQDARGTVTGHVTDTTGANVTGADVRVTNAATGVAITSKTNDAASTMLPT